MSALRFDWYGTGDSSGPGDAGTLARWREDVRAAAAELRAESGADELLCVGLRLGAAVAATSGERFRRLVLWDPVTSGRDWLGAQERLHRAAVGDHDHDGRSGPREASEELLGHPMTATLRGELEGLELSEAQRAAAGVVTITSDVDPWSDPSELQQALLPGAALERVVEALL